MVKNKQTFIRRIKNHKTNTMNIKNHDESLSARLERTLSCNREKQGGDSEISNNEQER